MPPDARPTTRRLALLLGGLAMFGPFSIDTIFPAFPAIGAQLGADKVVLMNMCGRGDKDIFTVAQHLGVKL